MVLKSRKYFDEAAHNLLLCYNMTSEDEQPSVMDEIANIFLGLLEIGKVYVSLLEVLCYL